MSNNSQMPWDSLHSGTIRQVFKELGFDFIGTRKGEMIEYLQAVERGGLNSALTLQRKRKASQGNIRTPVKRPRTAQEMPSKMITRRESMRTGHREKQKPHTSRRNSHFTFDCVLIDRPHIPKTRERDSRPNPLNSPEISTSFSPEIPPSSLPSLDDFAPTSDIAEEELQLPSSEPPEDRDADALFGPPDKSVKKTYAKRKVGRPRKSGG